MQAVILAAGGGTRLHPLTLKRSKAMLPIVGKPMVGRVLENLAAAGFQDFIVVANPQDQELIRYFEQREASRVQLVFQPQPRGAADALLCAAGQITGDFLLSACDNLVPLGDTRKVIDCWQSGAAPNGLLALLRIPSHKVPSVGIIEMEGNWIKRIVEKPPLAEAPSDIASLPLYCFTPDLLTYLPRVQSSPRGEHELQDAIQMLIDQQGGVQGIHVQGRMTLTDTADLLRLNLHFLALPGEWQFPAALALPDGSRLIPPVFIEPGVSVLDGCTIGPQVFLEAGCTVGEGVSISHSIVLRGASIPVGANIKGQVIA